MTCEDRDSTVMIRNTFIEMRGQPQSMLRHCRSSPEIVAGPDEKPTEEQKGRSERGLNSPSKWSDVSTDAGSEDDDVTTRSSVGVNSQSPFGMPAVAGPISMTGEGQSLVEQSQNASQLFEEGIHTILEKVATAVGQSAHCAGVEYFWDVDKYVVIAAIHFEHLRFVERLATVAKTAIVSATSASSQTQLLGYMKVPFVQTQQGFAATLGSACADKSKACHFMFKNGFCKSSQCRWHHPEFTATISFAMVVAVSEPPACIQIWQQETPQHIGTVIDNAAT